LNAPNGGLATVIFKYLIPTNIGGGAVPRVYLFAPTYEGIGVNPGI